MPNTCAAISDIGSYSEKQTKTVSANDNYLFWLNDLMANRVDVVILSISGDVGVEDIVLSSQNYSDGTANQYIRAKWEKGLFTIACASPSGYFQTAEMHFLAPTVSSLA